jgi:hypothetical protein
MFDIPYHPVLVFVLAFACLWLAAAVGVRLKGRRKLDDDLGQDFSLILAASLTLLALIIGFSFSMAANRYDQRKNLEEAEANAIGTEYLRADLLPDGAAVKVRALLKTYLDRRIQFYRTRDPDELRQVNADTARLQAELWAAVLPSAAAQPTPVVALAVSGMNDVLNSQGYTQAAWWNRIPASAWTLMALIAVFCNLLVGFGSRGLTAGSRLVLIQPAFVAIAFMFIADIDTPRHGVIRVSPQNLLSLADSLRSP